MIEDTFGRLAAQVAGSRTLSSRQTKDILAHLDGIALEIAPLAVEDAQSARSVVNFLVCALHESTRDDRSSALASTARKGMLLAFRPFEESRSRLAEYGYSLGNILSALGV